MDLDAFRASLDAERPPRGLPPALKALWWAGKDRWTKAHEIAQEDDGREAAWVHAYLHRVEGDGDNAAYWYRRAKRQAASGSLPAEWDAIARELLGMGAPSDEGRGGGTK